MRRRDFIKVIVGATAMWPLAARRGQSDHIWRIGFLGGATASAQREWTAAFAQRLHELGWIDGRNVAIEYRWAEGRVERSAAIVSEFIRLNVDVIVTHATSNVVTAKRATSVIPIVFASAGNPVENARVASLGRPGGNVTGLSVEGTEITGKRLELFGEVVPGLRRLALLVNAQNPQSVLEIREFQAAARALGLQVDAPEIRRAEDIAPAIEVLKGHVEALYVVSDPIFNANRSKLITLALSAHLPTSFADRGYVDAGGLMSYGPNWPDLFRRAAELVDKILRGAKPSDIPVEQPTKFDLVINLTTAKALGISVPATLLARADEVIE